MLFIFATVSGFWHGRFSCGPLIMAGRYLSAALFVVIACVGLRSGISTVQDVSYAKSSSHWPSVMGTVTRSEMGRRTKLTGRPPEYIAHIRYRYRVEGDTYEAKRIGFNTGVQARNSVGLKRLLTRYPESAVVRVFYDPKNPASSVLEPGPIETVLLRICGSVLFVFVGIMASLTLLKPRQKPTNHGLTGSDFKNPARV